MNHPFRRLLQPQHMQPAVILTHNPMADWLWGAAGTLVLVGVLALAHRLDEPAPAASANHPDDIEAVYAAGIEAGRAQEREAISLGVAHAYLQGLQDAACQVQPTLTSKAAP